MPPRRLSEPQRRLLAVIDDHDEGRPWLSRNERRTAESLERLGLVRVTSNDAMTEYFAERVGGES